MVNATSQRGDNNGNMQQKAKQKLTKKLKVNTDADWLSDSPLLRRQTRTIASGGIKEFVWWETDAQHKEWDSIAFGGKREFKWWESDNEDDADGEAPTKRKSRSGGDALTPTAPPDIDRGDTNIENNDVIMSLVTEEQLQIKAGSRDPSPDVSCMKLFKWKSRKSKSKEKKKSKDKNQVLSNGNPKAGDQGNIPGMNISDAAHSIAPNGHSGHVSNGLTDEINVETEIPLSSAIIKPNNRSMEPTEPKDLEKDNTTDKDLSQSGEKPPESKQAQNELNATRTKRNRPPLQKQLSIGKGGKGVLPWWDVSLDIYDKPGDTSPISPTADHWQKYGPTLGKTSTGLLAAGAAVGCKTGKVRDKVGKPHKELCRYDRDYYFNDFGGTFGERPNAEYGGESYKKANRR